jgi:hypothetical protein
METQPVTEGQVVTTPQHHWEEVKLHHPSYRCRQRFLGSLDIVGASNVAAVEQIDRIREGYR